VNLPAWQILRGVRRSLGVSQRELADIAELPQSTISRIEARRTEPRFETLCGILRSCGYSVVIARVHHRFDPVAADAFNDSLFDRAGRRAPAHLPAWLIRAAWRDYWWGWYRLAWDISDPIVPNHTYGERPRWSTDNWRWADVT
jgi:transcriptional regulator with XRE-family HTH domain